MIDIAALAARILLAAIFLEAGFSGLGDIAGSTAYFTSLGLPYPNAAAWVVALFELLAGLCLLFGVAMRTAALLLACFAVAAATLGHLGQGGDNSMLAFMHWQAFMKDIAISGGLVALAALGPGRFSLPLGRRG